MSSNRSVAIEMYFSGTIQRQSNPECNYLRQKLKHLNKRYLSSLEPFKIEQEIFPSGHIFYLVSFPERYYAAHTHTQFTSFLFTYPINCVLYRAIISSVSNYFLNRHDVFPGINRNYCIGPNLRA